MVSLSQSQAHLPPSYLSSGAVKSTSGIEEPLGAVARDGGAGPRDLLVHSWIMLNTAGDVSPGTVILPEEA